MCRDHQQQQQPTSMNPSSPSQQHHALNPCEEITMQSFDLSTAEIQWGVSSVLQYLIAFRIPLQLDPLLFQDIALLEHELFSSSSSSSNLHLASILHSLLHSSTTSSNNSPSPSKLHSSLQSFISTHSSSPTPHTSPLFYSCQLTLSPFSPPSPASHALSESLFTSITSFSNFCSLSIPARLSIFLTLTDISSETHAAIRQYIRDMESMPIPNKDTNHSINSRDMNSCLELSGIRLKPLGSDSSQHLNYVHLWNQLDEQSVSCRVSCFTTHKKVGGGLRELCAVSSNVKQCEQLCEELKERGEKCGGGVGLRTAMLVGRMRRRLEVIKEREEQEVKKKVKEESKMLKRIELLEYAAGRSRRSRRAVDYNESRHNPNEFRDEEEPRSKRARSMGTHSSSESSDRSDREYTHKE